MSSNHDIRYSDSQPAFCKSQKYKIDEKMVVSKIKGKNQKAIKNGLLNGRKYLQKSILSRNLQPNKRNPDPFIINSIWNKPTNTGRNRHFFKKITQVTQVTRKHMRRCHMGKCQLSQHNSQEAVSKDVEMESHIPNGNVT